MGLEKLETCIPVKVLPEQFYEALSHKAHELPKISPLHVKEAVLLDGEWDKTGSITHWKYVDDGKLKTAKDVTEADRKCNKISYKVLEGDLLECYKNFNFVMQATTDKENGGSVVHWTLEYEKLRDDVLGPYTLMHTIIMVSKDIEYHLLKC